MIFFLKLIYSEEIKNTVEEEEHWDKGNSPRLNWETEAFRKDHAVEILKMKKPYNSHHILPLGHLWNVSQVSTHLPVPSTRIYTLWQTVLFLQYLSFPKYIMDFVHFNPDSSVGHMVIQIKDFILSLPWN